MLKSNFYAILRLDRWDLLLWPASIGACWLLDRYHRRERDCIIKWKDIHHSNQISQLQEEIEAARSEQNTKNNQLKEYRSKITTLKQENETLKQEAILDPKPKKEFQNDADCEQLYPIW